MLFNFVSYINGLKQEVMLHKAVSKSGTKICEENLPLPKDVTSNFKHQEYDRWDGELYQSWCEGQNPHLCLFCASYYLSMFLS